ncbi:SGNH/GDSL hydrolase family protein [Kocuria rosea]|uniref:SGNH/GDSL hydrolase family protein n=1 Tax=Kocuria rosea TaxID=1275 RepID=UPI002B24BFD9|nr:SGNH/GDSL hydrolase family protein [Kocuria rosea]MEB2526490.1 SGNH/GDSL hydrolase family protein [Kocuria rosea]MEB2619237.1 SGNH/GDSL hydrolase family protein [Kocuria rosea]
MVADLANRTGRPVEVHTWDPETNGYDDPTRSSGQGEPIVLWNGSASGKKGEYSLEHIESMAPERPDLLVINHGHNQINSGDATSETNKIADWATTKWDIAPTIAVTLQNPSLGEREDRQAGVVRALRDYWSDQKNVVLIDTWTAFEKSDDMEALLGGDKLHPSEAGSELWAETAWKALSLDSV